MKQVMARHQFDKGIIDELRGAAPLDGDAPAAAPRPRALPSAWGTRPRQRRKPLLPAAWGGWCGLEERRHKKATRRVFAVPTPLPQIA